MSSRALGLLQAACLPVVEFGMLLILKLLLVPVLIGAVTWAGRRWGAGVAGRLSTFPLVAGPILIFITLEQGALFAAQAASAAVAAIPAFAAFALAYAWLAKRHGWMPSLCGAYLAYAAVASVALWCRAPLLLSVVVDVLALLIAARLLRTSSVVRRPRAVRGELVLRMVCGAALVLLITGAAQMLGARAAGVLALFPVLGTVVTVFSHRRAGAAFVAVLLRAMVWGNFAMLAFCATLTLALSPLPMPLAFALAVLSALTANALTTLWLRCAHG